MLAFRFQCEICMERQSLTAVSNYSLHEPIKTVTSARHERHTESLTGKAQSAGLTNSRGGSRNDCDAP